MKNTLLFPKEDFIELKQLSKSGGALIVGVQLNPAQVFELLEYIYGPYEDLYAGFTFIDDKSTWTRLFKTKKGLLRVYDFKGNTSIGYSSRLTKPLRLEAEKLKSLLETLWPKYLQRKKKKLKTQFKNDPLHNFMRTFLAIYGLLEKAQKFSSLMEGLVLLATFTDAQLRYGILLFRQIRDSTTGYDQDLIYQQGDKYIPERKIQKVAQKEGLISLREYKEISRLYDLRNRAVHRYFISDFEYAELPKILIRYEKLRFGFGKKLERLEQEQVKKGVGIINEEDLKINKRRMIIEEKLKIDSSRPTAIVPKRKYIFEREFGVPKDTEEFE